jgi:coronin-1B/1C/6
MRGFKTVNDNYVEPISFIVPRRAEVFQDDVYPPAVGSTPGLSSADWFGGKDALPPKIDLESVYDGNGPTAAPTKSFSPVASTPAPVSPVVEKKVEEPKPAPVSVLSQRAPPPSSMNETKGSIASLASKFADKDGQEDEEDDDDSSFEEVPKPITRSVAPIIKTDPKPAAPAVAKAEPVQAQLSSPTKAAAQTSPVQVRCR